MKECLKIQKPKKYNVVWNSVDENKFRPIKTNLKKKLNLKNKKILFSLGLLVEKKGFKYLIKAMPEIIKKHKDVVLLIGGHGKEENKLRKIVKELDLKNYVRFVEKIEADKTPHYYNACDIFVLPSIIDSKGETETLGVVLLEAMACAKPVVASNVGGIPDVVKKESGILVQQKNPKQIAEKINLLLSNEKLRKKMGIKGRNRIMQKFSWKATGQRLIKIYEELSNKI